MTPLAHEQLPHDPRAHDPRAPEPRVNGQLANHGVELVKLVCSFSTNRPADAETLRARCEHVLAEFVSKAQRSTTPADYVEAAKYAYVALIDERIMGSDLHIREAWLASPLQMRHFDSFSAGEEFYTRLEKFRHPQTPAAADVLEVYHLCLALGFRGKLNDDRGRERRTLLSEQMSGEILSARQANTGELSPRWLPIGSASQPLDPMRWHGFPVWLTPLILGAVVLLAAFGMQFFVANRIEAFTHDFPAHP